MSFSFALFLICIKLYLINLFGWILHVALYHDAVISLLRLRGVASSAGSRMGRSSASSPQEEAEPHREFTERAQASAGWLQPWNWRNKPGLGRGEAGATVIIIIFWTENHDNIAANCMQAVWGLIWRAFSSSNKSVCSFQSNQVCFSANQLVDIFALNPHLPISKEHFRQICPAIIQQLLGNACESAEQKKRGPLPTALESKTFYLMVSLYTLQSLINAISYWFMTYLWLNWGGPFPVNIFVLGGYWLKY